MDILAFGTPFGLAFASGLNAYLPMLAFTLAVRWLHLYKVNPNFAFITSNWFIAALVILTILDFVADKIPLIDHGWDAIHTFIRPVAGAVVAAASSQYVVGHSTTFTSYAGSGIALAALSSTISITGFGLLAVLLIGGVLAALMHTTKSTTRLVSTFTTAGFLNIGLSVVEDILVVIVILLSLFASSIMFVLLVLLILILVPWLIRSRYSRRHRRRGLL